jgi:hypothetical protein
LTNWCIDAGYSKKASKVELARTDSQTRAIPNLCNQI